MERLNLSSVFDGRNHHHGINEKLRSLKPPVNRHMSGFNANREARRIAIDKKTYERFAGEF